MTAFALDKINMTQTLKFVSGRRENILRKGENAGYQRFLLFSHSHSVFKCPIHQEL